MLDHPRVPSCPRVSSLTAAVALLAVFLLAGAGPAHALTADKPPSRFDRSVILDPSSQIGLVGELPEAIPGFAVEKAGWDAFRHASGVDWEVRVDRRSGAPLLVQGEGLSWFPAGGPAPTIGDLEARARQFVEGHTALFKVDASQLVLDAAGSGPVDDDHWIVIFDRYVDGVPVEGQRFLLFVTRGNLVSFGADRWGPLDHAPSPVYDADAARRFLYAWMGVLPGDPVNDLESSSLVLVPAPAASSAGMAWSGPVGRGTTYRLAWRFAFTVAGERGTWVGKVDAVTGEVFSVNDEERFAQAKGGVFSFTDDGLCPDGCEQPVYPMPYANLTVAGSPQTANDMGMFTCSPAGGLATTSLRSPYVTISDACGAVNESVACDFDLDLKQGTGTNCTVPPGSSPGNTHASRTAFYHESRMNEKARHWLPANGWLNTAVVVNTNVNSTCNSSWGGQVNMYRAGGGCRNAGENTGILTHEWGHGLDQNDGGGYDDPTEGYADVVGLFATHISCSTRGFFNSGNCSGYGDACLNCTGVRDDDWNQHASHAPATPQGFVTSNCSSGDGPCGKEQHCEGTVVGETMWDLAVRDLPAAGFDAATSWQIADKLFFKSRQGSGGNAYNCALPSSDGCNAGGWFNEIRNADDDDGNLANGTPHAAAIFSAFSRHNIACGNATDASNLNHSSCPSLAAPTLTLTRGAGAITLSWTAVPGAVNYVVLRNDEGCSASHNVIATVAAPTTTYTDTDIPNAFTEYYAVQAEGSSAACDGPLSGCHGISAAPHAGDIRLDRGSYACSDTMNITLLDLDVDVSPTTIETAKVTVSSSTETTPETITLTETGPDTAQFAGTIATSSGPVVNGDGVLQVHDGDLLTVTYHDANDGTGHAIVVERTVNADCAGPVITAVGVTGPTDESATVQWTTNELSTSKLEWGTTPALGNVLTNSSLVTSHAVTLMGSTDCQRIYFRVSSTDQFGNTATTDAGGGTPFAYNAWKTPNLFKDGFETATGWTLEGEWQIDTPRGLGHGPDPSSAWVGSKALGQDLTGLGTRPGDYENGTTQRATSPVIDASSLVGGRLVFRRWLNVITPAVSSIEVKKNGTFNTVWTSSGNVGENAWSLQTVDISAFADGNSSLQIAFKQVVPSFGVLPQGGWNVDRFIVKKASDPDLVSCGACGGAPTFAGLSSATDLSGCADTGVGLSWPAAPAWGTGLTGTYTVYRDTTPNFTPSAANRIAFGITATSYTDAAAPNGVTLYYLVRAENDETCSTGAHNGGVTDANTSYASVRDDLSQPAPGSLGGSLLVTGVNSAHVRLVWSAAANAASYHVYRANSPQGPFTQIANVTGTLYEDANEMINSTSRYYKVFAADSCGNEGP